MLYLHICSLIKTNGVGVGGSWEIINAALCARQHVYCNPLGTISLLGLQSLDDIVPSELHWTCCLTYTAAFINIRQHFDNNTSARLYIRQCSILIGCCAGYISGYILAKCCDIDLAIKPQYLSYRNSVEGCRK